MDEPQNSQPNSSQEPLDPLTACQKERDEYLAGWKRAKADFINYQKDESKRFEEFSKFAAGDLLRDLVPVLDSFDLAISMMEKSGEVEKGIYMIRSQLEDTLKRRGLQRVGVSPGEPFDPSKHEAVAEVESTHPPGSVAEVVEQGYALAEKVIRPARVKLAKTKTN